MVAVVKLECDKTQQERLLAMLRTLNEAADWLSDQAFSLGCFSAFALHRKRHLKKLSGQEKRFRQNENHIISKKLAAKAKGTARRIALEDLSGIRERVTVRGPLQRARIAGWAFFQLRSFIEYKSKLAGVPVVTVDPRNTSRTCPECGHSEKSNRKSQSEFECRACGHRSHADLVGARNIGSRARGAVNNPKVAEKHRDLPASEYCDKPPALAGGR